MVFFFGRHRDSPPQDFGLQFYEVPFHSLLTGDIYADFRCRTSNFIVNHSTSPQVRIIIASEFGMNLCGYLIVRWLIDERNCSLEEANRLFTESFPAGIRSRSILQSLYDLYNHDLSFPLHYRTWKEGILIQPASRNFVQRGVEPKPEISLNEEQVSIFQTLSFFRSPQHQNFDGIAVINPELSSHPISLLDSIGESIHSQQSALLTTRLNRRFKLIQTTPPLTPMKWFDKDISDGIRNDAKHIFWVFPLPLGLRCLLDIDDGGAFVLSEKGIGRQIEVTGIPKISVIDGFVSENEGRKRDFMAIDGFMIAGVDIRKQPYHKRLTLIEEVFAAAKSEEFSFSCVSISPLAEFEEILAGTEECPSTGICLTYGEAPSGLGGEIAMFFWRDTKLRNPIVQVKFLRHQMKCIGLIRDRLGLTEVADFGLAKRTLMSLDGSCVELKYNHNERQWNILGRSNQKIWTFGIWSKVLVNGVPPLSEEEIRAIFKSILTDPRYDV
jgi:hypothetical protein